ncbi:MAG: hypothetical protein R6V44_09220, partial [Paracoccaceae bacterium]
MLSDAAAKRRRSAHRQRTDRIEFGNRGRQRLNAVGFGSDLLSDRTEQLVLEAVGPLGGPEDLVFPLFE